MPPRFFTVSDNTLRSTTSPLISSLGAGYGVIYSCNSCGRTLRGANGPIEAILDPQHGSRWLDAIGCGPMLIVSERVIDAWQTDGLGELPYHPLNFLPPFPRKLRGTEPPNYYWIDGGGLRGALLDFDASGFAGVKFCPECSTRSDNIWATGELQASRPWPFVLRPGSWNGAHLFTTDLSHTAFFCTDALLNCAARHRLTNFKFIALEDGRNPNKMVRYM